MNTDILKRLFIELFEVNHLMLDLIFKLEDTDNGDDLLTSFYMEYITKEFETKDEMLQYAEGHPESCINELSNNDFNEFVEDLYN